MKKKRIRTVSLGKTTSNARKKEFEIYDTIVGNDNTNFD
jgi:hypothetical protein